MSYYQTLGVLEDAEDIVIRAAYRALAQKYHPDKWRGDPAEATKRMAEINEAYEVLSDPAKRKSFDSARKADSFEEEAKETQNDLANSIEADWKAILDYLPKMGELANSLACLSSSLAFSFKVVVVEQKAFARAQQIAEAMKSEFLIKYFGRNPLIQEFAQELILSKRTAAAKELNRAVVLLGPDVDPDVIINRIRTKFPEASNWARDWSDLNKPSDEVPRIRLLRAAKTFIATKSFDWGVQLLREAGHEVSEPNIFRGVYRVKVDGLESKLTPIDFLKCAELVAEKVLSGR